MSEDIQISYSFPDPAQHPEWTPPQTEEFYARLVKESGKYNYPWSSLFEEPTAEMILEQKVLSDLSAHSRVLDVGCGDGEFTSRFSSIAGEVAGIDITKGFIDTANATRGTEHTRFSLVNADDSLPFPDHYFDVAYTKKGPMGWYQEAHRVVKPGGTVYGLYHGGTDGGLRKLFPGLYSPLKINYDEAMEALTKNLRLQESGLTDIHIVPIEEIEYLAGPEDVLKKKCFGQSRRLKEYVWKTCLPGVEDIFNQNACGKGLKVINYHYLLSARTPEASFRAR